MKRGKYEAPRAPKGRSSKKGLAMLLSLVLLIGCVAGGTLAWLTAQSDPIVNTFESSTIGVVLTEDESTYKMIPGHTINKNPTAKITTGSEYGYLFVEVTESVNFDQYMVYAIDEEWTKLENVDNVYYIKVDTTEEINKDYRVLGDGVYTFANDTESTADDMTFSWANDQLLTKPELTKDQMPATKPTLTFKAYAVQLYKDNNTQFSAEEAWNMVKGS